MIRPTTPADFDTILAIIQDGARAYKGVIPADRLRDPYMSAEELQHEIDAGVRFSALDDGMETAAVMGVQDVDHPESPVTLIRHAYVATTHQGKGYGTALLEHLRRQTARPILIGTWADSYWAIGFYQKHGFRLLPQDEKNCVLRIYWTVPERQIEASVVLADERWASAT